MMFSSVRFYVWSITCGRLHVIDLSRNTPARFIVKDRNGGCHVAAANVMTGAAAIFSKI